MSLGGSEIVDHGEPINNLIEKLKCLKKKGHKGGKRCKSWVQQQSSKGKKKKKKPTKDTVRQQLSKVSLLLKST